MSQGGQSAGGQSSGGHSGNGHPGSRRQAPPSGQRQMAFLTQLMVDGDSDLRKRIGRSDVAGQRQAAYGQALASRPSAQPLSFLRVVDTV